NSRQRERGSSRRLTVMRYPTRVYQSDRSSLPLGRSDDCLNTRSPVPSNEGISAALTTVFPYQNLQRGGGVMVSRRAQRLPRPLASPILDSGAAADGVQLPWHARALP